MGLEPVAAFNPDEYVGQIASIPNPVANFQQALAFKVGLAQKQADTAQAAATAQELGTEAQAKVQQLSRAQEFQQDLKAVGNNPNAQSVSDLIMKYPEFADQLKSSWDVKDNATKQADLTQLGEVYSAAAGGNWDMALKQARVRVDADKATGNADPSDQAMLDQITQAANGDPTARKAVLTTLGTHLAAVTGPDHFASVYGALNPFHIIPVGGVATDDSGNIIAHSPIIQGADGEYYRWDDIMGGPGGTPKPGATPQQAPAPSDLGGFDHAAATVLHNEGGYNASDMNGSPTMRGINWKANEKTLTAMGFTPATFHTMTDDQAKQIYQTYWSQSGAENLPPNMQTPYFDVYIRNPKFAKSALAQSKGDPTTFMNLTSAYFGKLAKTPNGQKYAVPWANRDANNRLIAMGGAPTPNATPAPEQGGPVPILPGRNSPDQYRTLSPDEAKQRGLDPNQQYQINTKTGQVAGLGQRTGGGDLPGNPSLTGEAYLATVPTNLATQARALVEGRLPMPSSFALAKPYWQQLLQIASQYDPSFDASTYAARKAAITAFTGNGKGAQIVGSVNRVANHLALLNDESKKLAGPDLGWSPLNSLAATTGQSFEPQDAKAYDTEVGFVAGELGKIAKAGVVTEGEVNRIIANLDRKQSASTRAAAIKAAVGIISGAVDPLKDQYNSAFPEGVSRPNIPWVSPKAQQIYKSIGGVDMSLTGEGAGSNAPADNSAPVAVSSPAEAAKLPSGTLFKTPDGRILRKR